MRGPVTPNTQQISPRTNFSSNPSNLQSYKTVPSTDNLGNVDIDLQWYIEEEDPQLADVVVSAELKYSAESLTNRKFTNPNLSV
jgi:hypothetical protein